MGCDFNSDNDLSIEYSSREECPTLCKTTNGCTHFVWMKENGGTCNLLTGGATKSDALLDGYQVMCGIIEEISFYKKLLKESKFNLNDYNELWNNEFNLKIVQNQQTRLKIQQEKSQVNYFALYNNWL